MPRRSRTRAWPFGTASRSLSRVLDSDPDAIGVLEHLERRTPVDTSSVDGLVRWKRHEFLRIAARDLLGIDTFELVAAALAAMAADVLDAAVGLADADGLAVIGMGKLGGRELNYASDVDVMLVSDGEHDPADADRSARAAVDIARRCFRVDLNLRPEGRNGALVRTLPSYEAYWDRWAEPWEFRRCSKPAPSVATTHSAARSTLRPRPICGRDRSRPTRFARCAR